MIGYGSELVEARPGARLRVRASGPFVVFAVGESGQRLRILGPNSAQKRSLVLVVPPCKELEIECAEDVCHEIDQEELPPRREIPDQTPVELSPGMVKPESLESIMARMIQERFDQMAQDQGMETFEEADDFDVSDEHELPRTPYEMVDMDEDAPFYPEVKQDSNLQLESKGKVKDNVDSTNQESTDERTLPAENRVQSTA